MGRDTVHEGGADIRRGGSDLHHSSRICDPPTQFTGHVGIFRIKTWILDIWVSVLSGQKQASIVRKSGGGNE